MALAPQDAPGKTAPSANGDANGSGTATPPPAAESGAPNGNPPNGNLPNGNAPNGAAQNGQAPNGDVFTDSPGFEESPPEEELEENLLQAPPEEPEPQPEPEKPAPPPQVSHAPITLRGRYVVYPGKPVPEMNSPNALAFEAEDKRDTRPLFALICPPSMPVRLRAMATMRGYDPPGILPMVDFMVVEWPVTGEKSLAVIMERPKGGRLIDALSSGKVKITEYDLPKAIMEPINTALQELNRQSLRHRALRLDNLYFMNEDYTDLVIGECFTSPPGYDQPILYEPVERGMAMPAGRGIGTFQDDVYAFGVLVVVLLLGYDPTAKMSDEDLFAQKVELGSYAALCGQSRVPVSLLEPLRGMLSDDSRNRWNAEALDQWINGRQQTPIQRTSRPKPKNVIRFAGRDHKTARTLAFSFSKHVAEAARLIRDGKCEMWVRQSLGQDDIGGRIAAAVTTSKVNTGKPEGSDDLLVAKVCMALDPWGPIRYKGFSFVPEGFGPAVAMEYTRKGSLQLPAEIMHRDLVDYWLNLHNDDFDDLGLDKTFTMLKRFLVSNDLGMGIERCLYELNSGLPCQSDLVAKDYVAYVEDLLPALDNVASTSTPEGRPIDRHIAAFIAARFRQDTAPHMRALNAPEEETQLIGMVSLLALIQWRLKSGPVFGLTSWVGGLLGPAINTYHSRTTRREIEQQIPGLVRQGSLPELFDLIDNAERRAQDDVEFETARIEFINDETEIEGLITDEDGQNDVAMKTGERSAAMGSMVLAMIASTIMILVMSF